jgi:hypothetical protein
MFSLESKPLYVPSYNRCRDNYLVAKMNNAHAIITTPPFIRYTNRRLSNYYEGGRIYSLMLILKQFWFMVLFCVLRLP